jgi:hypothetical protein
MTEQDTLKLIRSIADNYQAKFKVEDKKAMVKSWHKALQHHEFSIAADRLDYLIAHLPFPPALSDLVRSLVDDSKGVPNVEQTRAMLNELVVIKKRPSDEEISNHLAAIRANLTGEGGGDGNHHSRRKAD